MVAAGGLHVCQREAGGRGWAKIPKTKHLWFSFGRSIRNGGGMMERVVVIPRHSDLEMGVGSEVVWGTEWVLLTW
jgi:hypothetical protein